MEILHKAKEEIKYSCVLGPDDNWNLYIKRFSHLDIYYSREYLQLFAKEQHGISEAIYYENDDGKVFYPYIKREIQIKEGYFDTITPYGYGGPVLEGKQTVMKEFYDCFKAYCLKQNIITETVCLHPLLNNVNDIKDVMPVDFLRKTTAVDLTLPLDDIRQNYSSNNRRNIRKAIREGVQVTVTNKKEDIIRFKELYDETMDRNNALSFYYFDKEYFFRQMEDTALSKSYLLTAKYNGKMISGILLIIGQEYAHCHLVASKTEFLHLRPNNLLFDYMIEFSKTAGAKALHLGGGYKDHDSLFRFKTLFSNNNNFDYYLGKNIIDQKIYDELSQAALAHSSAEKGERSFFPLYRKID
ncbi:GNAT family N-acetyltransferase [Bacillus sp. BRMEA1]|uniref:lipid II:glycine glycyltransferase FemX n=1 Tax=Neobacillus endophyticus TaxID=2738405 RepID=UPI0015632D9F|nr:GNAT family N-acetyltransferase [Neobacillus endophyticus]NRD76323.1 GNAT family N-acetyltransferase [Neobacillus endophyticus]